MTVGISALVSVKVESCLGSQPICITRLPNLENATDRLMSRALADAALTVNREYLGVDLHQVFFEVNLNAPPPSSYVLAGQCC